MSVGIELTLSCFVIGNSAASLNQKTVCKVTYISKEASILLKKLKTKRMSDVILPIYLSIVSVSSSLSFGSTDLSKSVPVKLTQYYVHQSKTKQFSIISNYRLISPQTELDYGCSLTFSCRLVAQLID